MTYSEFKSHALNQLNGKTENAQKEIDILISHFSGMKRNELLLYRASPINQDVLEKLTDAITRRLSHEPLQYIIEEWEFFGLRMFCGKGCLIPRPETEMLAEIAINNLPRGGTLLDLCTGSGCIPVSVLNNRPDVSAVAVDISPDALYYAKKNAEYHGIASKRLKLINADIYECNLDFFPDMIVSNPPYIKSDDLVTLSYEVKHEPVIALDGGYDGLDFYKLIAKRFCKNYLTRGSICAVEVGYDISEEVASIFRSQNFQTSLLRDSLGIDRVCISRI